jgi:hypothetical protein
LDNFGSQHVAKSFPNPHNTFPMPSVSKTLDVSAIFRPDAILQRPFVLNLRIRDSANSNFKSVRLRTLVLRITGIFLACMVGQELAAPKLFFFQRRILRFSTLENLIKTLWAAHLTPEDTHRAKRILNFLKNMEIQLIYISDADR